MPRRTTGEGSIYKRKDSSGWVAQVSADGKRKTFTGKTRKEAKEKLDEYLKATEIAEPTPDVQFGDFLTDWMQTKQRTLKPTSYDRLECTVNNQILPALGEYKICDLTYDVIQREVINKAQDKGRSYSTIKKIYNVMNECIRYAIFPKEIIVKNPMLGVTMPSKELFESKEIRCFSDDEIARFKTAALAKWNNGKAIYPLGYGLILMLNGRQNKRIH